MNIHGRFNIPPFAQECHLSRIDRIPITVVISNKLGSGEVPLSYFPSITMECALRAIEKLPTFIVPISIVFLEHGTR